MKYSDTDLRKCIADNDGKWDGAMLAKAWLDERADSNAAFKNFHRQLCLRFGYTHDEKDWFRDQVSLIEWVATHRPTESPYAVIADALDCFWNASLGATHVHQDSTANAVLAGIVEGVSAIATRLQGQPTFAERIKAGESAVPYAWCRAEDLPRMEKIRGSRVGGALGMYMTAEHDEDHTVAVYLTQPSTSQAEVGPARRELTRHEMFEACNAYGERIEMTCHHHDPAHAMQEAIDRAFAAIGAHPAEPAQAAKESP